MTYIGVVSLSECPTVVSDLLSLSSEVLIHSKVAPGVHEVALGCKLLSR